MLKGNESIISSMIGTTITVIIILGILGTVTGSLVIINNELATSRETIAGIEMKHIIKECFVRESGGLITEEFLERGGDIEDICGFDGVTAEVSVSGKTYSFGGPGDNIMIIPVQLKTGEIQAAEMKVNVNV